MEGFRGSKWYWWLKIGFRLPPFVYLHMSGFAISNECLSATFTNFHPFMSGPVVWSLSYLLQWLLAFCHWFRFRILCGLVFNFCWTCRNACPVYTYACSLFHCFWVLSLIRGIDWCACTVSLGSTVGAWLKVPRVLCMFLSHESECCQIGLI